MENPIVIDLLNHPVLGLVVAAAIVWLIAEPFVRMARIARDQRRNEPLEGSENDMAGDRSLPRSHRGSGFAGAVELEELDMNPHGSKQ